MKCDTVALKDSILQIKTLLEDVKVKSEKILNDEKSEELLNIITEITEYNNRVLSGIVEYDKAFNKVCDYVKRVSL